MHAQGEGGTALSTAPHPTDGPDLAVLADLAANLLPPAEDRLARAHAEGCAECTSALHALEQVGSQLRWLPPIAMPADVIARVDAALAAQASVVSIDQLRERRTRRRQLLGVAAAGLIVLGGGGVLISQLGDDPSDSSVASGDAGDDAVAPSDGLDLDESSLPGAVSDLVTGGEDDQPLELEGTPAPERCVPGVQLESVEELIGVIEIRYGGRSRDAVFFTTSDPTVARVIVVDDCALQDPAIDAIVQGQI